MRNILFMYTSPEGVEIIVGLPGAVEVYGSPSVSVFNHSRNSTIAKIGSPVYASSKGLEIFVGPRKDVEVYGAGPVITSSESRAETAFQLADQPLDATKIELLSPRRRTTWAERG